MYTYRNWFYPCTYESLQNTWLVFYKEGECLLSLRKEWVCVSLTSMPSCVARTATCASTSGSFSASLSARAARALPMFPRHTRATSSRWLFTHIRAMFSHTASLEMMWNKDQITSISKTQNTHDQIHHMWILNKMCAFRSDRLRGIHISRLLRYFKCRANRGRHDRKARFSRRVVSSWKHFNFS